jgi:hypothetical protein
MRLNNSGEMAEWSNAAVSKTVVRLPANRGFESPSLRKVCINHAIGGIIYFNKVPKKACFLKELRENK